MAETGEFNGISCPTTLFCAAFATQGTLYRTNNGGDTWSRWKALPAGVQPDDIVCASTTSCQIAGETSKRLIVEIYAA
jgi:photosystem II stability/assembly factor-like uncharacterized protein